MVEGRPAIAFAAARARFFGDWLSLPLDAECFLVDAMVASVVQVCSRAVKLHLHIRQSRNIIVVKFFLFFSHLHNNTKLYRVYDTDTHKKPCPAALYRDRDAQCKRDTNNEEHRGQQLQA